MNRSVKKPLHLYTHDVTGKIYVVNRWKYRIEEEK